MARKGNPILLRLDLNRSNILNLLLRKMIRMALTTIALCFLTHILGEWKLTWKVSLPIGIFLVDATLDWLISIMEGFPLYLAGWDPDKERTGDPNDEGAQFVTNRVRPASIPTPNFVRNRPTQDPILPKIGCESCLIIAFTINR